MIDLENLKAKYPTEFAAVFAAGREEGVSAENDRVGGHLRAAELSGAHALARAAIADGRSVEALSTAYLEAGFRRRKQLDRLEDDAAVAEASNGAAGSGGGSAAADSADVVANIVCQKNASEVSHVRIEAIR